VTFLQAIAWGKPLVLLPAVMVGRFQHNCISYNCTKGDMTPRQLEGKRVGVVGIAASAIQFVPEIAPKVGKL
jgi:4,5-dihydroxyphthalate decarboxylase